MTTNKIIMIVTFLLALISVNDCTRRFNKSIKIQEIKENYGIEVNSHEFTLGKCRVKLKDVQLDDGFLSNETIKRLDECNRGSVK